jgi:hypothetical protein
MGTANLVSLGYALLGSASVSVSGSPAPGGAGRIAARPLAAEQLKRSSQVRRLPVESGERHQETLARGPKSDVQFGPVADLVIEVIFSASAGLAGF